MKLNGYKIREQLRRFRRRKQVADSQFPESLWCFAEETKATPAELAAAFAEADRAVAELETLQQRYNSANMVELNGETITLALAVKMVGGAGRLEKLWRDVSTDRKRRRYGYDEPMSRTREADAVVAQRMVSYEQAARHAEEAAEAAAKLREVIAEANAKEIDVGEIKEHLLA